MSTSFFLVSHATKTYVFCGVMTGIGGPRGPIGDDELRPFGSFIAVSKHHGAVLVTEHETHAFVDSDYVKWTSKNYEQLFNAAIKENHAR